MSYLLITVLLTKLSKHQTPLCSGSPAVPWGQNCTFPLCQFNCTSELPGPKFSPYQGWSFSFQGPLGLQGPIGARGVRGFQVSAERGDYGHHVLAGQCSLQASGQTAGWWQWGKGRNVFPFARTSVTPSLPRDGRKSTKPDKLPAGAIYI